MLPQYVLLEKHEMKPCTRVFTTTIRLPYAHKIEERQRDPGKVLKLKDIHTHWHLKVINQNENRTENVDALLEIHEPNTIRPAGRPPGARNKRRRQRDPEDSTTRDPSGFEYSRALFEQVITDTQRSTNQESPTQSHLD